MKRTCSGVLASLVFVTPLMISAPALAQTSPSLGLVGSYSVLGHTTVTNTGGTTMPGDLGISIGGAPVGFPPGTVGPPGTVRNAADALDAQAANTAAFLVLDQVCNIPAYQFGTGVVDLVGASLVPGVYCADAFRLTGTLTLVGSGVWIFKTASDLITSGTANVVGGDPCNVWWRVASSATLGTNTSLIGNILALTSIGLDTGASLNGRALAQTGAVTLASNPIAGPVCATTAVTTPETTPGATPETTPVPVPTLPGWAVILLTALLALAGFAAMRRRAV